VDEKKKNNRLSMYCLLIWNVFIYGILIFLFVNLLKRRISGASESIEESVFLILIPVFLIVNIKPVFLNIRKLYSSYQNDTVDEKSEYEAKANRYAFMNMYRRLSIRRICLVLSLPLLYLIMLAVFLPIASKGVISWKFALELFYNRSMQLAFLPFVLVPSLISLRIYFASRHNIYMLMQIYDRLSVEELENIDSIKEKQMAYVFTKEFLINWDGCLNIVPLKEIKRIEYVGYFYFFIYGTRLRLSCNKKYVIWSYGPSEAEWVERGFLSPKQKAEKSISFNIQLPH
jgi:hypothetical protein